MNRKKLEALINGLLRHHQHGSFKLINSCQGHPGGYPAIRADLVRTEQEIFDKGYTVNFYGVIALLPEFQEDGGYMDRIHGLPQLAGYTAGYVVQKWLGISSDDLEKILSGGATAEDHSPEYYSKYYMKKLGDVHAEDVIQLLTEFDRGYRSH